MAVSERQRSRREEARKGCKIVLFLPSESVISYTERSTNNILPFKSKEKKEKNVCFF